MAYYRRLPSGRWRVELRDPGGKRFGQSFDTKGMARAWADEQAIRMRRGRFTDPRSGRQPFSELEERWWMGRITERSTAATDRNRLDRHVLPHWESWPVEAITRSSLQAWIRKLTTSGLAPATVRSCVTLMVSVMEAAVSDGLVPDNPARGLQLPAKTPSREVFLSQREVEVISEAMARRPGAVHFDRAVLAMLAYTGIRWGEAAGLRRHHLDPMLRTVTIAETLIEINGAFSLKGYPKSGNRRIVPLTENLRAIVAEHLRRYPAEMDQLIFRPSVLGYRWGRGEALSRHHWGRIAFRPAVADALGRDDVHVHDLRHSYATWLAAAGVPLTEVAALLGHSSVTTTLRYAHATEERFERARAALSRQATL